MSKLRDVAVDIKIKWSGLWASTVLCYLYCDYFELYTPSKLESMIAGDMAPFGQVSQGVLLGMSLVIMVPCLMVCLSLLLPAKLNKWFNIVFGVLFTMMMALLAYMAGWTFYQLFAVVEAMLTAVIVWLAWKWPREEQVEGSHV